MARPITTTPAQEALIAELHAEGLSLRKIAVQVNLTAMGVQKALKRISVLPSWCSAYPVSIPHMPNQPKFTIQTSSRLVAVLDPEQWHVSAIQARYQVPHAKAYQWFKPLAAYAEGHGRRLMLLWKDEITKPGLQALLSHKDNAGARTCSARETEVKLVDSAVTNKFYEAIHLQGRCNGSIHYGLYFEDRLVACMSFGHGMTCRGDKNAFLLQRFATIGSIPGAASKLLKAFRSANPGPIISYSDNRYAAGGIYATLGFEKVEEYKPDYRYFRDGRWYAKNQKQRKDLIKELGTPLPGDTEYTMAERLGYFRCFDLGKISWRLD